MTSGGPPPEHRATAGSRRTRALDLAVGVAAGTVAATSTAVGLAGRGAGALLSPVADVARVPVDLLARRAPAWVGALADEGGRRRRGLRQQALARVDGLLRGLDPTALVSRYVDIDRLVASVDVEAMIGRVDLPEIIRESTGAVSSEAIRSLRMRSISGDDAFRRAVDRLRLRRSAPPDVPPEQRSDGSLPLTIDPP